MKKHLVLYDDNLLLKLKNNVNDTGIIYTQKITKENRIQILEQMMVNIVIVHEQQVDAAMFFHNPLYIVYEAMNERIQECLYDLELNIEDLNSWIKNINESELHAKYDNLYERNNKLNIYPANVDISFNLKYFIERYMNNQINLYKMCKSCGQEFSLAPSEISWYKNHKLELPMRCSKCRKNRKQVRNNEKK